MSSEEILVMATELGHAFQATPMNFQAIDRIVESFTDLDKRITGRFPETQDLKKACGACQFAIHTFSVFRSAHILGNKKRQYDTKTFSMAYRNMEALAGDIQTTKSYIDIPNSLLWMLMRELFFAFECACNNTNEIKEFSVIAVIEMLKKMIKECDSIDVLHNNSIYSFLNNCEATDSSLNTFNKRPRFVLGILAQITLVRIFVVLADYRSAIKACDALLLFTKSAALLPQLYAAANVTLFYHAGFALMMLRRYAEAAQAFQVALSTPLKDYEDRDRNKAAHLLSISSILGNLNIPVSTSISPKLKQSIENNEELLRKCDSEKVRNLFIYNAPRFLPALEENKIIPEAPKAGHAVMEQQFVVFKRQVHQRLNNNSVVAHFKAYKTLTTAKIAEMLQVDKALSRLISAKLSSFDYIVTSALLSTERAPSSDTKFRIDADSVTTFGKSVTAVIPTLMKRIANIQV